jgi:hypothetical protein
MSKPDGPQFIHLYHFAGTLGDSGEQSIRKRGLLPLRTLHPDFYDDDEWVSDHERVWAFDSSKGRGRPEDMVEFKVPLSDVEKHGTGNAGTIYSVPRTVTPEEIVNIIRRK